MANGTGDQGVSSHGLFSAQAETKGFLATVLSAAA